MTQRYRSAAAAAIMTEMPASVPELVHPIPVEEVPGWARAMTAAFLGDPDGPQTARRIGLLTRGWDPALAARRYAVPGEVVLEVIDEDVNRFAAGRFQLTADGDEVACEPTDRPADLEITQPALASIYLGGFRLRELLLAGRATERTPGALGLVDLMFSTPLAPWTATSF
jgi:hypothetical protein